MKVKRTAFYFALSMTSLLAACSGGGADSAASATPASAPSTSAASSSIAPITSVATPTYPSGSMQASAFSTLNAYRLAMGVGELAQDPLLDTSATAHALYLDSNLANGNLTALSHDEVTTYANYYDATPLSRAHLAGIPSTEWIDEDIAAGYPQASAAAYGINCINIYLDTVYHLQNVTSNQQTIGVGFQQNFAAYPNYTCVLDFGETADVSGAPQTNSIYVPGGQQLPVTAVAHSPLVNETDVPLAMIVEDVNPAPDITAPGHPIMVRVNAANVGDVLTVSTFTLTAADGTVVPGQIIVPSAALIGSTASATADVNGLLAQGVAFLLPLVPLTANTTYTATFSGARDGTPINATWNFTTAAS